MLSEQQKKRYCRIGKWLTAIAVFLTVLYCTLTSSYVICNVYLPLVSSYLNVRIEARNIRFSFFRKENIRCKDLNISVGQDIYIFSSRLNGHFSQRKLLVGIVELDGLKGKHSEIVVKNLPQSKKRQNRDMISTDRLRIGSVQFSDLVVRYAPENTPLFVKLQFDELKMDAMKEGRTNKIQLYSELAYFTKEYGLISFPVTGKIDFQINKNFLPKEVAAEISLEHPKGKIFDHMLQDSSLNGRLALLFPDDHPHQIVIKQLQIDQIDQDKTIFSMKGNGVLDVAEKQGKCRITQESSDVNPRVAETLLEYHYRTNRLNLKMVSDMDIQDWKLTADTTLHFDAESILYDQMTILKKPSADCKATLVFDFVNHYCKTKALNGKLYSDGKEILQIGTTGAFSIRRHMDASLDADAIDGSLNLKIRDFPAAALNPQFPLLISSGNITADCSLIANAKEQRLVGTLSGKIDNETISTGEHLLLGKHKAKFNGRFSSRGLDDIREFIVEQIYFELQTDAGQKLWDTTWKGNYLFTPHLLSLNGKLTVHPYSCLMFLDEKNSMVIKNWMQKQNAENTLLTADLQLKKQNGILDFSGRSKTDLSFLAAAPKGAELRFSWFNTFDSNPDSKSFTVKNARLEIPGQIRCDFSGSRKYADGMCSADFKLDYLRPAFLQSMGKIFMPDDPYLMEIQPRFCFENIKGETSVSFDEKKQKMTIRKLDLSYIHKKDRELTLSLQNPVSGNPASMQFQPANVRLLLNNFPADSINPFFKGHTNFGFRQSLVSGYIQATTQDLVRDVLFDIELYLEDFGCKKKNLDVVYGNCKVTGHCELHDFFSTFSYKDASGLGLVNGAEAFVLKSNGDMSFTDDMPCQFHIEYVKATQDHFRTFMPGITDSILLEKLVSSGKIDISCLDEYDDIYLHWEQNINELKLFYPSDEDETPEILKGKMVIDYRIDDIRDNLDFKKCSLFLQTPDNQTVMDIVVDGRWAYQEKKEKTTCLITVNQLDAKMLHLAIKGSGEQKEGHKDNEKKAGQKKIKHWSWKKNKTYLWPIQENEPAPIDIGELETTLNFDIKNCTYDKLSAKATGRFHVDDNIFQADSIHSDSTQADSVQCGSVQGEINGGKFQLALFADLGKADGWILKGDIKLTNMKLDPFFQSLGSEATKKKNITGAINDLDLHIRTKGITLENLDKNLQASGSANVSGISFPFNDSDGVNVLHVLLFPTLALPRLIDTLPDIKMRKVLKDYMGNQLDVLSGYKNIVLEKGEIQFHSATESRKTDQIVDKANFQGSDLNVTTEKATINPFYNEIDMRTKTVFGTIRYPMHATGVLTNPNFHRQHFVVDFVNENLLQSIWNKQKKEDPPPDDDGTGSEDDKTKEKPAQKP